jgi:major vault protein
MKAEALAVQRKAELDAVIAEQNQQLEHQRRTAEIEIQKARELGTIEAEKFQRIVNAIGADTIAEIARAGPEMQAKLLGSLGIKSVLLTDGRSPVNLFNTASGLIGNAGTGLDTMNQ